MEGRTQDIVLALTVLVMLIGLVGVVVPVVPGTILILGAALVYAVLDGFQAVGWPTLIALGLLTLVATTADIWATSAGAKAGGASGWSVVAGLIGGLVGLIVFSLPGSILGALLGMVLVEMMRVRDWRHLFKASGGWLAGWLVSVVLQIVIGVIMIAIFVWQAGG